MFLLCLIFLTIQLPLSIISLYIKRVLKLKFAKSDYCTYLCGVKAHVA